MKTFSQAAVVGLFFCCVSAQAMTCASKNSTEYYFANGINVDPKDARQSSETIGRTLGAGIAVKLNYNHTSGILLDLIEAARQKYGTFNSERSREILSPTTPVAWRDAIIQRWHAKFNSAYVRSPELKEHVARYTADLRAGRKVAVLAHSQGNFYANEARLLLTATLPPDQLKGLGIFGLAVPANNVGGNSGTEAPYLTNNLDIITSIPGSMAANTVLIKADGTRANISGLAAHGLIETYLSSTFTLVNQVVTGFKAMTAALPSPTPVCGVEAMDLVSYFGGYYSARTSSSPSTPIVITDTGTVSLSGVGLLSGPASLGPQGVTATLGQGLQTLALETSTGDRFTQSFKSGAFDQAYLYSTSTFYSPVGTTLLANTSGPAAWMLDRYSWMRDYLTCSDSTIHIASLSAGKVFLSGLPAVDLAPYSRQVVTASAEPSQEGATVNVSLSNDAGDSVEVAFAGASGIRRLAFIGGPRSMTCVAIKS